MQRLSASLVLMGAVLVAGDAAGQQRRRANTETTEAPPFHGGAAITIHVEMVEHLAADGADVRAIRSPDQLDAWMKELAADRKLLGVTTMEMGTVDGREAMTQFGERAAVVTRRTRVARGEVNSYDYVEIGTVVRATPRIQDDGAIVVELQLEKSDISPLTPQLPADEGGEADVIPPNVVRMTVQSMLRLNDGQTFAAYRKATSSPQGMVETALFVTAAADDVDLVQAPGAADPASTRTSGQFRQFRLKSTDPSRALRLLQEQLVGSPSIRMEWIPDANTIMAYAHPDQLEEIAKILECLEAASSSQSEE